MRLPVVAQQDEGEAKERHQAGDAAHHEALPRRQPLPPPRVPCQPGRGPDSWTRAGGFSFRNPRGRVLR